MEGWLDVCGMNMHVTLGGNGHDGAKDDDFDETREGFNEINACMLNEAMCNKPGFEAINGAISIIGIDFEDHFFADDITANGQRTNTERSLVVWTTLISWYCAVQLRNL
jgi:hypothetical protein